MGVWNRIWKRYERHIMLGLVTILLATFSITGAMAGCFDRGGSDSQGPKYGGTYLVSANETTELTDAEYAKYANQFFTWHRAIAQQPTSIAYRDFMAPFLNNQELIPEQMVYSHRVAIDAAKEAGYKAGPKQISRAVKELVSRTTGMAASNVVYQRFLRDRYPGGTAADFRRMTKELVLKDMFLAPLIDTERFAITWEEAYEQWKKTRERVDLEYVALDGSQFADVVALEEKTRSVLSRFETAVGDMRAALVLVRRTHGGIAGWRKENPDAEWPGDFAALVEAKALQRIPEADPWGNELHFAGLDGAEFDLRSVGPDGKHGTDDDVRLALEQSTQTYGAMVDVVRATLESYGATKEWPADLATLRKPIGEGLPPLKADAKDGYGKELRYEAASGDGTPAVVSAGPDGTFGNDDDIRVQVEADADPKTVSLPATDVVTTWLPKDDDSIPLDGYGNAPVVSIQGASPLLLKVTSNGPDGVFGNDDDISGGNEQGLRLFFQDPDITEKVAIPQRREFEALYVHLPLFPDSVLEKLWNDKPEFRPESEEKLFQEWMNDRGDLYKAEKPGDPETGHGATSAKELAPDATLYLVPRKDIFPASLDDDAKARGVGEGDDEEKGDGENDGEEKDDEEKDDGKDKEDEEPVADPQREEFLTSGWREILIRQRFIERYLQDIRDRLLESQKEFDEWERVTGLADPGAPTPPKPTQITFKTLLAGELNPYMVGAADADKGNETFRYYVSKAPEADDEWREIPDFKDPTFAAYLQSRVGKDEYVPGTIQIRSRTTKALARNLTFMPRRNPKLEEVRDVVFEEFLKKRQLDYAVAKLKELQEAAPKPSETIDEAERETKWKEAIAAWQKDHGKPVIHERTGMFIASAAPGSVEVDEDATDEASMRQRRQNFMWMRGYDSVRSLGSRQDQTEVVKGAFGRSPQTDRPVSDGGTGLAYLVRVADRADPSREEFSPRRYTDFLGMTAFGSGGGNRLDTMTGKVFQAINRYFGSVDALRSVWRLQTNENIERFMGG